MRVYTGCSARDHFFFGPADSALPGGVPPTPVTIEGIGGGVFDLARLREIADAAEIFGGLGGQTPTSDRGGVIEGR